MPPPSRAHVPEPRAGSLRSADGRPGNLFDVRHYPVTAVCRTCGEKIRAETFFQPFQHTGREHEEVHRGLSATRPADRPRWT